MSHSGFTRTGPEKEGRQEGRGGEGRGGEGRGGEGRGGEVRGEGTGTAGLELTTSHESKGWQLQTTFVDCLFEHYSTCTCK